MGSLEVLSLSPGKGRKLVMVSPAETPVASIRWGQTWPLRAKCSLLHASKKEWHPWESSHTLTYCPCTKSQEIHQKVENSPPVPLAASHSSREYLTFCFCFCFCLFFVWGFFFFLRKRTDTSQILKKKKKKSCRPWLGWIDTWQKARVEPAPKPLVFLLGGKKWIWKLTERKEMLQYDPSGIYHHSCGPAYRDSLSGLTGPQQSAS